MNAGKLRHRVEIQQLKEVSSNSGQTNQYNEPPSVAKSENWETFKEVWAAIEPQTGQEQEGQATVAHKVTIRYLPGVSPKMRLKLRDGRILDIGAVLNTNERNIELVLLCKERVS